MAQICADHVPNIGRKSPSILLFCLFWHLILAILAAFLPPLLFLTHLRGWWLTLWLVTDIWWNMMKLYEIVRPATIQAQQLWYLSTCSTAASPQFLSTRASARASSKSSASNSAGPACQQLFTYPNGDLTLLFNATYATRILNEHSYISIRALHHLGPDILCPTGVCMHMAMKAWKVGHGGTMWKAWIWPFKGFRSHQRRPGAQRSVTPSLHHCIFRILHCTVVWPPAPCCQFVSISTNLYKIK